MGDGLVGAAGDFGVVDLGGWGVGGSGAGVVLWWVWRAVVVVVVVWGGFGGRSGLVAAE